MSRLKWVHYSTKKTSKGNINQIMVVSCDYDYNDDYGVGDISNIEVDIYQDGKYIAEISQLLDDAEGNPLAAMLESINWHELYHETKVAA